MAQRNYLIKISPSSSTANFLNAVSISMKKEKVCAVFLVTLFREASSEMGVTTLDNHVTRNKLVQRF